MKRLHKPAVPVALVLVALVGSSAGAAESTPRRCRANDMVTRTGTVTRTSDAWAPLPEGVSYREEHQWDWCDPYSDGRHYVLCVDATDPAHPMPFPPQARGIDITPLQTIEVHVAHCADTQPSVAAVGSEQVGLLLNIMGAAQAPAATPSAQPQDAPSTQKALADLAKANSTLNVRKDDLAAARDALANAADRLARADVDALDRIRAQQLVELKQDVVRAQDAEAAAEKDVQARSDDLAKLNAARAGEVIHTVRMLRPRAPGPAKVIVSLKGPDPASAGNSLEVPLTSRAIYLGALRGGLALTAGFIVDRQDAAGVRIPPQLGPPSVNRAPSMLDAELVVGFSPFVTDFLLYGGRSYVPCDQRSGSLVDYARCFAWTAHLRVSPYVGLGVTSVGSNGVTALSSGHLGMEMELTPHMAVAWVVSGRRLNQAALVSTQPDLTDFVQLWNRVGLGTGLDLTFSPDFLKVSSSFSPLGG